MNVSEKNDKYVKKQCRVDGSLDPPQGSIRIYGTIKQIYLVTREIIIFIAQVQYFLWN